MVKTLSKTPSKTLSKTPLHGLSIAAEVVRVIDGDTIEVEIRRKFPVRLIHPNNDKKIFQAPELRDEPDGQISRDALVELLTDQCANSDVHPDFYEPPGWKPITVFIPADNDLKLTDIMSFRRILGEVWVDDKKVTDVMLKSGMAKMVKRK